MFTAFKERQQARQERQQQHAAEHAMVRAQALKVGTDGALNAWTTLDSSVQGTTTGPGVAVLFPQHLLIAARQLPYSTATRVVPLRAIAAINTAPGRAFATVTVTTAGQDIAVKLAATTARLFTQAIQDAMTRPVQL